MERYGGAMAGSASHCHCMRLCVRSMIVGLLVLLALTQVHVLASPVRGPARPNYIDCGDSSECGAWECCVLGERVKQ